MGQPYKPAERRGPGTEMWAESFMISIIFWANIWIDTEWRHPLGYVTIWACLNSPGVDSAHGSIGCNLLCAGDTFVWHKQGLTLCMIVWPISPAIHMMASPDPGDLVRGCIVWWESRGPELPRIVPGSLLTPCYTRLREWQGNLRHLLWRMRKRKNPKCVFWLTKYIHNI